jgi:hypothetical protein
MGGCQRLLGGAPKNLYCFDRRAGAPHITPNSGGNGNGRPAYSPDGTALYS